MKSISKKFSHGRNLSSIKIIAFIAITLITLCSQSMAQTEDYSPDRLYFKIWDTSNIILPEYDSNYQGTYPYFNQLINSYQITKIFRPFTQYDNLPQTIRTYELLFTDTSQINELISDLKTFYFIEYAEKMPIIKIFSQTNDTLFNTQWYLNKINADSAWNITHGDTNVVVAIIDNAIRMTHEDLYSKIYKPYDIADSDSNTNPPVNYTNTGWGHGTHCAGIIGATTNNLKGISSLGYNIKIMPIKINNNNSLTPLTLDFTNAVNAIKYAINNKANIISMSWGFTSPLNQTMLSEINRAHDSDIICVASVGNIIGTSSINYGNILYPAKYDHVIGVGATDHNDLIAGFSNFGSDIGLDVMAPGTNILSLSAQNDSSYESHGGTSQSCALVAALCGLIKSNNPLLTPDDIETCITQSAIPIDIRNPLQSGKLGAGRINAPDALNCYLRLYSSDFNSDDSTQQACVGKTKGFFSKLYGQVQYHWDFGDGVTDRTTIPNDTHTYFTQGIYSVKLVITDISGLYPYDSTTRENFIMATNCDSIFSTKGNWLFGNNAGIDFKSGKPKRIDEAYINTVRPTLTQSDSNGNLLFYCYQTGSGSDNIYIKNQLWPLGWIKNGENIPVNSPFSGLGITIPYPIDTIKKYYIIYGSEPFIDTSSNSYDQFRYSEIYIDGINDSVVIPSKSIIGPWGPAYDYDFDSLFNKIDSAISIAPALISIPGIPNCNNLYWIIAHGNPEDKYPFSNMFYVFILDESGIHFHHFDSSYARLDEYVFRASPDGKKIALIDSFMYDTANKAHAIVYDFDKVTGTISNPKRLEYGNHGFCFSPNSKLFYIYGIEENNLDYIYQYDLTRNDPNSTVKKILNSNIKIWSMQLGPDSIIYLNGENSKILKAIYFPNNINTDLIPNNCGYADHAVFLVDNFNQNIHSGYFFPNFIDALPPNNDEIPFDFTYHFIDCNTIEFCAPYQENWQYHWVIDYTYYNCCRKLILPVGMLPHHYTAYLNVPGIGTIQKTFTIDAIPDFTIEPDMHNCNYGVYDKFTIKTNYDLDKYIFNWTVNDGSISENYDSMIYVVWDTIKYGTLDTFDISLQVIDKLTGCDSTFNYKYVFDLQYANGHIFNGVTWLTSGCVPFVPPPPSIIPIYVFGGEIWIKGGSDISICSDIIMRSCSEIIVDSNSSLNINNNSKIYTCDRWKGITLLGNSMFGPTLSIDSASISNAEIGIYSDGPSYITISNTTFLNNKNHIAIINNNNNNCNNLTIRNSKFGGFYSNNYSNCNDTNRNHAIPEYKMIYLDSIFTFEMDSCNLEGQNIDDSYYDGIFIKNYNNSLAFSIHNDTFIGSFNKIIKINTQFISGPVTIINNIFNAKARVGLKIDSLYVLDMTNNDFIGDIDTAIDINESRNINIFSNYFDNRNCHLNPAGTGFLLRNTEAQINSNRVYGYYSGGEYYCNTPSINSSITTNLFDSNKYGILIADSINPELYTNTGIPTSFINLTIGCNKFYNNIIGIFGSGNLSTQGNMQFDASNDFIDNYDWNMFWQDTAVNIDYYFNDKYSLRTNPNLCNYCLPHILNGMSQFSTDVDSIPTYISYACFNTWIFIPPLSIIKDDGFKKISVYPNPFNNNFTVSFKSSTYLHPVIIVYDIFGKEMFKTKLNNEDFEINTDNWNAGIYLIKFTDDSNSISQFKLLKL